MHSGSRYGQVGSLPCEFCGASIAIVDHDNIVESIKVNDEPCSFEKLYLLSADYIEWFEEWYGITMAPESLLEGWINLLDKSTVPLPDYVSKIGEEDAKTLWLG